jgi:hypothetical protein
MILVGNMSREECLSACCFSSLTYLYKLMMSILTTFGFWQRTSIDNERTIYISIGWYILFATHVLFFLVLIDHVTSSRVTVHGITWRSTCFINDELYKTDSYKYWMHNERFRWHIDKKLLLISVEQTNNTVKTIAHRITRKSDWQLTYLFVSYSMNECFEGRNESNDEKLKRDTHLYERHRSRLSYVFEWTSQWTHKHMYVCLWTD